MSEILSAADVQSRLEDMCDVDGLDKAKKAREVYGVMQTISTQNVALRAEVERLRKALGYITDISEANADRAIVEMKRIAHEALDSAPAEEEGRDE